jgi:hypothetical protein
MVSRQHVGFENSEYVGIFSTGGATDEVGGPMNE